MFSIHGLSGGFREIRPDRNFRRSLETVSSTMRHRKIYARRPLSYFIRPPRYDVPVFVLSVSPSVIYTVRSDVAVCKQKKMKNPLNASRVCPRGLATTCLCDTTAVFRKTLKARFRSKPFRFLRRSNSIRTTRS